MKRRSELNMNDLEKMTNNNYLSYLFDIIDSSESISEDDEDIIQNSLTYYEKDDLKIFEDIGIIICDEKGEDIIVVENQLDYYLEKECRNQTNYNSDFMSSDDAGSEAW